MRRKISILAISLCLAFCLSGCGGDNRVDTGVNTNENETDTVIDLENANVSGTISNSENIAPEIAEDSESSNETGVAGDSETMDEIENDSDIGSEIETVSDSGYGNEINANDAESGNEIYSASEENSMLILNLSGTNLYDLTLSFSNGMENQEILGEDKLKDGSSFVYAIKDMESLKSAKNLKLSVIGKDKKEEYDFGSISVIDPSNIVLVLTRNQDGYYMYIK